MKVAKWRGIWKLVEEFGEVLQLAGKLGPFPGGNHPDGKGDLKTRMEDEIADAVAAILYVIEVNDLDDTRMRERTQEKLAKFRDWGLTGVNARG